ncbi:hypothetical protein O181_053646 [Austropuccinia psidii MF-1]|uniref:RPA43 OB domain-containing protein n=1 Tax=Austropuccinia psidii MF-1 TaxID=1389203 RepID=A0A9Q3E0V2_9BASI|nr:hypothetical protein [Austropuccinia psidii MF-1]
MLESSLSTHPSDFHHITAQFRIPLAPVFFPKPSRNKPFCQAVQMGDESGHQDDDKKGLSIESKPADFQSSFDSSSGGAIEAVNQTLASLLMKYIPSLGSVLLSYMGPPTLIFPNQSGRPMRQVADKLHRLPIPTLPGVGWGAMDVEVNLLGWRPTVGQKLIGRPTLSSPSHLSLVVYQTFNASIPENHLKSAGYYYDISQQIPQSWKEQGGLGNLNDKSDSADQLPGNSDQGCWVDPHGNIVGGTNGLVSFTVISLTIANHMISVIGTLHPDPFSIEPPKESSIPTSLNISSTNQVLESEMSSKDVFDDLNDPPSKFNSYPVAAPTMSHSIKSAMKSNTSMVESQNSEYPAQQFALSVGNTKAPQKTDDVATQFEKLGGKKSRKLEDRDHSKHKKRKKSEA